MQGIFQKENTDKALKYGIYRHLPTYEKIIRNLVSFYNKKVEDPFVCDGYINKFYFSIGALENEIVARNISAFRKEVSVRARRILEVFDEIINILSKNKVDEQYYKLDLE